MVVVSLLMDITAALIFAFTIVFSPFAGIVAYLINYDEYQHHFDSKTAKQQALRMAIITFLVFVAAGLVAGFVMRKISG